MAETFSGQAQSIGANLAVPQTGELIERCDNAEQILARVGVLNERLSQICAAVFGAQPAEPTADTVKAVAPSVLSRLSGAQGETHQALEGTEALVTQLARLV